MIDRRLVLATLAAAAAAPRAALSQQSQIPVIRTISTSTLDIAYEESGPAGGFPVLLMHGFPYDPRAFDDVVAILTAHGCRSIVPYLRGYGRTRFRSAQTLRSGQQAAFGQDLIDLMDALAIPRAVLGGFDWGGRGACVAAALWPERVQGLVSANGYGIQDIASSVNPAAPEQEHRMWYQYYFHTERGRAGLTANRREFCKLLWKLWSPNWKFDDATYERTAVSFDNPDFVDVVIQSYRHRFGYAPGDPALEPLERRLATRLPITVATVVLQGEGDGVGAVQRANPQDRLFTGAFRRQTIPVIGHDVPQEAPTAFANAVLELVPADRRG